MPGSGTAEFWKWSESHQFTIEYDNVSYCIFFDDRDLYLQVTYPDSEPINYTIKERMFVPGLSQFKRGVQFRYYRNNDILYLQFPHFDGLPSFAISLALTTNSRDEVHTEIPGHMYDMLAEQYERLCDSSEKTMELTASRDKTVNDLNQKIAALEKKVEELQDINRENKEYIDGLPRNLLVSIRGNTSMTDFTIVCKDGKEFEVHKAVLGTFWPFFAKMMENTCKESEESRLKLDYDGDVVDTMLADFYGCTAPSETLTFTVAISLLELTGIYDLPELAGIAYERVLMEEPKLVLADCVSGWKSARLGNHSEAKKFFSEKIVVKSKTEPETGDFDSVDREELLELFLDSMRLK